MPTCAKEFLIFLFQIEYDDRAKTSPLKEQPKAAPKPKIANNAENEEDDFDIDAI